MRFYLDKKNFLASSISSVDGVKSIFWWFVFTPAIFLVIFIPISDEFAGKAYGGWIIANFILLPLLWLSRDFNEPVPLFEYIDSRIKKISYSVKLSQEAGIISSGDLLIWWILAAIFRVGHIFLIPNLLTVPMMYIYCKLVKGRIGKQSEIIQINTTVSESVVPTMLLPKLGFYALVVSIVVLLGVGLLVIGVTWYSKVFI